MHVMSYGYTGGFEVHADNHRVVTVAPDGNIIGLGGALDAATNNLVGTPVNKNRKKDSVSSIDTEDELRRRQLKIEELSQANATLTKKVAEQDFNLQRVAGGLPSLSSQEYYLLKLKERGQSRKNVSKGGSSKRIAPEDT